MLRRPSGGYRARLYSLLAAAGYTVDFVGTLKTGRGLVLQRADPNLPDTDNEGHGGYQIHEIDAGIEGWLNAVEDPDVVLLLIGTNDYTSTTIPPCY